MREFVENNRKRLFIITIICTYLCALAFFWLTPFLSDDYAYLMELRNNNASGVADAARLAFGEYFEHGGRLVTYITFRLFLLAPGKFVFNLMGGVYFVTLGLLIYANVDKKKSYDIGVLLLSFGMIWFLAVEPGQTIFWLSGSVGYLFTTVYILGSITFYRYLFKQGSLKKPWLLAFLMFLISLVAGNCSENNSAAAIFIFFMVTLLKFVDVRRTNGGRLSVKNFLSPYMVTAFLGYVMGYLVLILSPGTWGRAAAASDDNYTGFLGFLSHIYKMLVTIKELFLPLLIAITVFFVILVINKRFTSLLDLLKHNAIVYIVGALAGLAPLAVISPPMPRAYFGQGIFLIIAAIALLQEVGDTTVMNGVGKILKYSVVAVICLLFTFTYLENLVNLARIYRESNEQVDIMEQAVEEGRTDYVEVPMLHEDFDNKYTIAYFPQIDPDPEFWINTFYEGWYGIERISSVPREIWDEEH